MKFKELFDREIITEEHVRKELKIYYELDLNLIKPKQEEQPEQNTNNIQTPEVPATPTPDATQMPAVTPDVTAPVGDMTAQQTTEAPAEQPNEQNPSSYQQEPDLKAALSSVVTEDEVSVNDENKIVRKFEGEISLSEGQKDNTQSFEDIIQILGETKKDGTELLDEFSLEMINLCITQNFNELKTKLDKKSKIFVEVFYGFKKDDSIGVRFNKRPNSDTLTSTMLVDNEIVATKFSIDKVNQRVAEYRNYEATKNK